MQSAVLLLAEVGYQGTSFSSVLEHSGAPRGSVYHHFPGGKDELIAAALDRTVELATASLEPLRGRGIDDVLDSIGAWWRNILVDGEFRRGCPIVAVSGGIGAGHALTPVVRQAFLDWETALGDTIGAAADVDSGARRCHEAAVLLLGSLEGALAYGRATGSIERFDAVAAATKREVLALVWSEEPLHPIVAGSTAR